MRLPARRTHPAPHALAPADSKPCRRRERRAGRWRTALAGAVALVACVTLATPGQANATSTGGDSPAGFYFATDSTGVPVATRGLATTPAVGGGYGGYTGMAGDWARSAGCGSYPLAWSAADAAAANRDATTYHTGVGAGAYWFMGGPGVDPHYNGTAAEAAAWGRQAGWALSAIRPLTLDQPVLWMDVELPGSTVFDPVTDNGWTKVYRSACDAQPSGARVTPALARAEIYGFAYALEARSGLAAGVYSDPAFWAAIFGTGPAARLSGIYEWTANDQTAALTRPPSGWCRPGLQACARFFGGVTASSRFAVAWQWSGGEGTANGIGDFDTVEQPRMAAAGGRPPPGEPATAGVGATATGYLEVTSAGGVYNFHTPWYGSAAGRELTSPVVGMAVDQATGGYWLVTAAGNVYNFHAPWYGSAAGRHPTSRVTAIVATTTGYLLATAHGNVYGFHTAWHGSEAGGRLRAPVTGIAADLATGGYWLVTAAGQIYGFDAPLHGSPAGLSLAPVVGMAATRTGYLVASAAGNVYDFHTPFHGSDARSTLASPVVGVAVAPGAAGGYWLAAGDGMLSGFDTPVYGRAHTSDGGG